MPTVFRPPGTAAMLHSLDDTGLEYTWSVIRHDVWWCRCTSLCLCACPSFDAAIGGHTLLIGHTTLCLSISQAVISPGSQTSCEYCFDAVSGVQHEPVPSCSAICDPLARHCVVRVLVSAMHFHIYHPRQKRRQASMWFCVRR